MANGNKIYLRGPKSTKRVLVLHKGVVYEYDHTVPAFWALTGSDSDRCEVVSTDAMGGIQVIFCRDVVRLTPAPVFDPKDVRLEFSVDTIAETTPVPLGGAAYCELWSFVTPDAEEKESVPSLGKVLNRLSLKARREIEKAFAEDDAETARLMAKAS